MFGIDLGPKINRLSNAISNMFVSPKQTRIAGIHEDEEAIERKMLKGKEVDDWFGDPSNAAPHVSDIKMDDFTSPLNSLIAY